MTALRLARSTVVLMFAATATAIGQEVPARIVAQLQSPSTRERSQGFEALRRVDAGFESSQSRELLLALLARETRLFYSVSSPRDSFGEGWEMYYDDVITTCEKRCDWKDPRTPRALAASAFNAEPKLSATLAAHLRESFPVIMTKSRDSSVFTRADALRVLTNFMRQPSFPGPMRAAVSGRFEEALGDRSAWVRTVAANGLAEFGDRFDLKKLQKLVDVDPSSNDGYGQSMEEAQRAATIATRKIRERMALDSAKWAKAQSDRIWLAAHGATALSTTVVRRTPGLNTTSHYLTQDWHTSGCQLSWNQKLVTESESRLMGSRRDSTAVRIEMAMGNGIPAQDIRLLDSTRIGGGAAVVITSQLGAISGFKSPYSRRYLRTITLYGRDSATADSAVNALRRITETCVVRDL